VQRPALLRFSAVEERSGDTLVLRIANPAVNGEKRAQCRFGLKNTLDERE
jgi:hypothetical protein